MMLKTVYGPPPADADRIEAAEEIGECALVREDTAEPAAVPSPQGKKVSCKPGQRGVCA